MKIWRSRILSSVLGSILGCSIASVAMAAPHNDQAVPARAAASHDPHQAIFPAPKLFRLDQRRIALPGRISITSVGKHAEEQHAAALVTDLMQRSGLAHPRAARGAKPFLRFRKTAGFLPKVIGSLSARAAR